MPRFLVVGLAAIVALLLGSLAVIALVTGAGSSRTGPASATTRAAPAAAPAPEPPPVVPVDLARAPLKGVALPPPVIVSDARPPPPPADSWEAVPILPARRGAMGLDLEDIQPRLAQCFHPDVEARYGPTVPGEVKDSAPLQDEQTTTLILQLEVAGDRLRVVDAPVESRSSTSDGTLACAQAVLRGQSAPAAGLPAGKHRMRFLLTP